MTPSEMARIHAAAFVSQRPWTQTEFTDLRAQPHIQVYTADGAFAVTRTIAGESELLTLATAPASQRKGIARSLLTRWLADASLIAETAFLDVAADNAPALALYMQMAFTSGGLRTGYYKRAGSAPVDAVLMTRALTSG